MDIRYDDGQSLEPTNPVIERIICELVDVTGCAGLLCLT